MSNALPSSTFTFLFTDIEGSTAAWERDPGVMSEALTRHDRIARGVFEARSGRVFATAGDAFSVAFGRAAEAIHAGLELQSALAFDAAPDDPVASRVRAAVHSGEAEERDGDYFGRPLNRAARLLAIGHGGQVLVSGATAALVRESLPEGATLLDLGEHRLRDLGRPERVHQLVHPDLPAAFPPLRSLDASLHNLPLQLTSLVGRERELDEVGRLIGRSRLVTLTGAGGSGKTRLALHVAASSADAFPDGVWLVELASLADPELVPRTVAGVLDVQESPARAIEDALADHLRGRALLLLLDNCEHLIEACARFADGVLRSAAGVRILATSREGLGVAGEIVWLVPSLSLPESSGGEGDPAAGESSEAVGLFVDRARLVDPDFAVTAANAGTVTRICRRLDGIPLAIELAAALVRVLSPDQIAARLDDRFRLLSGGSRTALPRHQTLRAAIDWSWDHLEEEERILFRRLAVFAGGWTLEAAEAVCAEDLAGDALDLLTHLVDKSLVVVDTSGEEARYRMLETVRQYALDRLLETGETGDVRDRHLDWFARRYQDLDEALIGVDSGRWITRLEADHDNVRAALEWGLGSERRGVVALGLATGIARFWARRGYLNEGIGWLERALEREGEEPALRSRGLRQLSSLLAFTGRLDRARRTGAEAEALAREAGSDLDLIRALGNQARVLLLEGDPAGGSVLEEALDLAERSGPGAAKWLPGILGNLGEFLRMQGRLDEAEKRYREALDLSNRIGNVNDNDTLSLNLGQIALQRGDPSRAAGLYRDAIAFAHEIGRRYALGWGILGMGQVLAERGELEGAARLFGAVEAMMEKFGFVLDLADRPLYERALTRVRRELPSDTFDAAWKQGRAMGPERAVEEALAVR